MACSVLGTERYRKRNRAAARVVVAVLAVLSFGCVAGRTQSEPAQCLLGSPASGAASVPAAQQKQVLDLQQSVEAGPFYKELLHLLGKPKSCDVKVDGDNIALSFAFREGAQLDAKINSTIEYSEQRAQFGGLNSEKAIALLKKGAADSFGADGCGINWNKPEEESADDKPGSRATVFRGDSCNCQARVVYQGRAVVALVVSSSC